MDGTPTGRQWFALCLQVMRTATRRGVPPSNQSISLEATVQFSGTLWLNVVSQRVAHLIHRVRDFDTCLISRRVKNLRRTH
jgi:hypothetical protein